MLERFTHHGKEISFSFTKGYRQGLEITPLPNKSCATISKMFQNVLTLSPLFLEVINQWPLSSKVVIKYEIFNVIQFLCKPFLILWRFDWYNTHSHRQDVEWKIYITVLHFTSVKLKKIACCKVKVYEWNTIHLIKQHLCCIKEL